MAQHFLLSSASRDLDIGIIHRMTEERALARFKKLAWADTKGDPVCPECGGLDHWVIVEGKKWSCKGCKKQFSPTSGTIFKGRKLSYRQLLIVLAIFSNGVNGVAACRLAREVKISYKSAFVLLHKIRETMGADEEASQLSGVVEIDGAVFGRHVMRLPNDKSLWDTLRGEYKQKAKKRKKLIVVIRERQGPDPAVPAKVKTFMVGKEGDAIEIARKLVLPGSVLHADMSGQWEGLHMYFKTMRINHSEHYSFEGACTNLAESFFSRMRTAERGVYKIMSGAHLSRYAMELGWREQYRRKSNGAQFTMLVGAVGRSKPSTTFKGYWRKRPSNDNDDFFQQFA